MKRTNTKELDDLNKKINAAKDDPEAMRSYALSYFMALRHYIPEIMHSITIENDRDECIELLQLIFPAQYELMALRTMANVSFEEDLWEIAEEFDNNDPNRYDYIIQRIKNKEYMIQKLTV